jgi:hypothetical protein
MCVENAAATSPLCDLPASKETTRAWTCLGVSFRLLPVFLAAFALFAFLAFFFALPADFFAFFAIEETSRVLDRRLTE